MKTSGLWSRSWSRDWRVPGVALALLAWGALAATPASAQSHRAKRAKPAEVEAPADPAPAATTPPVASGPVDGSALGCVHPEESNAGSNVEIICAPSSIVDVARMQVFYRTVGSEGFTKVAMDYSESSGHRAVIPGTAVRGRAVQYYCEAYGGTGAVVASDGREDSPNTVLVHGAPGAAAQSDAASEAAPVEGAPGLVAAAEAGSDLDPRAGSLWVGLAFGSAYGWQPTSTLERRKDLSAEAGFAGAGLGYFAPEVGYRLTRNFAVAVRGRHQVLPAQGKDPEHPGSSARWAHSVLVRGLRTFSFDRSALFVAGQLGGGQGMRFYFPARSEIGLMASDTSQAGPVLFGPAAGYLYRLSRQVAMVAEVQVFLAAPHFATFVDTDLGVQLTF